MSYWKKSSPGPEEGTGILFPKFFVPMSGKDDHRIVPEIRGHEWRCRAIVVFTRGFGWHESQYQNMTITYFDKEGACIGKTSGIDVLRFEGSVQMDVSDEDGPCRYFPPGDERDAYFHVELHGSSTVTAWVEGIDER